MRATLVRSVSSTSESPQVNHSILKLCASVEDNVWLYLQDLQVARSFAAADIVDGCLVVTGGDTELGPTDSVEIIEGILKNLSCPSINLS